MEWLTLVLLTSLPCLSGMVSKGVFWDGCGAAGALVNSKRLTGPLLSSTIQIRPVDSTSLPSLTSHTPPAPALDCANNSTVGDGSFARISPTISVNLVRVFSPPGYSSTPSQERFFEKGSADVGP